MADEDNNISPVGGREPGDRVFIESVTGRSDSYPGQVNGQAIDREEDDGIGLLEYWRLLRRRQGTLIVSVCLDCWWPSW